MFLSNAYTQTANLARMLWQTPGDLLHAMPKDEPVTELPLPGGMKAVAIRDPRLMQELSCNHALDRLQSVNLLRSVFGENALFLVSHDQQHSVRAAEINRHLGARPLDGMFRDIAAEAENMVDRLSAHATAHPGRPIDLHRELLQYLIAVGARAITGTAVDLSDQVDTFHRGVQALHRDGTAMYKSAIAAAVPSAATCFVKETREAATAFHEAGRRMLVAAARHRDGPDSLALATLRRHKIDPATVNEHTRFPQAVLVDISMNLAASLFTTANLIEMTLHHYFTHPAARAALRAQIDDDYPNGLRDLESMRLCPTLHTLVPVMVDHTPLGFVSREVKRSVAFSEPDAPDRKHRLNPGDTVLFDMTHIQARQRDRLVQSLDGNARSLTDWLATQKADVLSAFFKGAHKCPGIRLALLDASAAVIGVLARLDARPVDPDRPLQRGIINHLGGSPQVVLTLRRPSPASASA